MEGGLQLLRLGRVWGRGGVGRGFCWAAEFMTGFMTGLEPVECEILFKVVESNIWSRSTGYPARLSD